MNNQTMTSLGSLHQSVAYFVSNFINKTGVYIIAIGLFLAVVALMFVGLRVILSKNADERTGALDNVKGIVIGVFGLALFSPIIGYILVNFFS